MPRKPISGRFQRFFLLYCSLNLLLPTAVSAADIPIAEPPSASEEITTASQILALPGEKASRAIPVKIRGVVTVAEKYWGGRFFIQDESGGVFVDNISTAQPSTGD